jgi:acyl CoA:acetate/3-ketoacid CoA transferase alpha subunit
MDQPCTTRSLKLDTFSTPVATQAGLGNLSYALTARNFNPVIAMAADTVIVSADNIVPVGVLSPDHIVTPAPLVDYLIAN